MELSMRPHQYQPKRFNLGFDFGSTYSSAAFVLLSASIGNLQASKIMKIPYPVSTGHNRYNCYETPTVLRYEELCTRWGWDAKKVEESGEALPGVYVDMIKLLLDETQGSDDVERDDLRRRREDTIRMLGKTVIDVLVDYLTPLFRHIMNYMIDKGYYDPRDTVELDCTVPAIWKERSRRKMLAAIDRAGRLSGFGFGKAVWLVSEPEAASSYVLTKNPQWDLQEGENILLCDAGGGTVDLITYTITQQNPLRVQEAVAGTGGLCGSNYLNSRCFEQTLQRLDNAKFIDGKKSQQVKTKLAREVTTHFEKHIKPIFSGKEDVNHLATVPRLMASSDDEFRDDSIIFTPDRLTLIFDPIISQVWDLVRSQLQSARDENFAVQKVCLVGGFGGSERLQNYLKEKLVDWTTENNLRAIDLFVPETPAIATAYGATLRSMDKKNGAPRKCRSSLGITVNVPYHKNSPAHKNAEKTRDDYEKKKFVRNCLDWMIELNEILPPTEFLRKRELYRDVPINQDTLILSVTVYSSDKNKDSFYPITHAKNHDHEELEEVNFTLDMTKFRDKLTKRRRPKPRKKQIPKYSQGISGPLRKSSRNRTPTTKGLDYQNILGTLTSDIAQAEVMPLSQPPSLDVSIFEISSALDSPKGSEIQPLSASASEPDDQTNCCPPEDDESTPEYYYRVPYKFIIEIDGLIIKYRMDIPIANECIEGEINLAQILPPGAS